MRQRPALLQFPGLVAPGFVAFCAALSLGACTITPVNPPATDAGSDAGHVQSANQCATGELTCGANATCLDGPSHCVCNNGYTGDGHTCTDVNECTSGTTDCSANATCTNTPGSYTCQCNTGFTGDGRSCTPSATCVNGNGGCSPHAICTQNSDSVSCACADGYTGDGMFCAAQGACGGPGVQCDPNANCTNVTGGGYTCACVSGFTGNGLTCTALNQCTGGSVTCGANTVCTPNLVQGGYTCPCASGYALNNAGVCVDVYECTNHTAQCAVNATCTNTAGSYTCACPTGYSGNGVTCTAINACTSHTNDCDDNATCASTGPGTFTCTCKSGYSGSGTSCAAVDACTTDGGSSCPAESTCVSTGPGTYSCSCDSGYTRDGGACVSINPCLPGGTNTCGANASCAHTGPGTYTCACDVGYTGDGTTCAADNYCTNGTAACPGNSTCVNAPGSDAGYTCNCDTGFTSSNGTCADINECTQGTNNCCVFGQSGCSLTATCENTEGSYYCECPPGDEGGANCTALRKQLATGDTFACDIQSGALSCWGSGAGSGEGSQASPPTSQEELTAVAITNTTPASAGTWTVVSAGPGHACAIDTNGSLYCWGTIDASGSVVTTPVRYGAGSTWADVAAGNEFTCALKTNGTLWCWGLDSVGQVGDGTTTNSTTPHQIGVSTNWETITAGDHHACGMQAGQVWCWGGNESGQVGSSSSLSTTPVLVSSTSNWAILRAGAEHTCALQEASNNRNPTYSLWCWGNNTDGQLGTGPVSAIGPQQVPNPPGNTSPTWTQIAPGLSHTCALTTDHLIYCWGDNSVGELGNSGSTSLPGPVAAGKVASSSTDWDMVAAGSNFSCGHHSSISGSTQWQCWGSNSGARLGIGSDANSPKFVTNANSSTEWSQVVAGPRSACAINFTNTTIMDCWGDNTYGQLGNGITGPQQAPTAVVNSNANSWTSVAIGATHTCATQGDGSLWCWGDNTYGQLGTAASATPVTTPQRVGASTDWTQVAAGTDFTCGIESGTTLWCWGRNDSNQLGSTTTGIAAPLTQVTNSAGNSWSFVATGDAHACAIDSSAQGLLWCWGNNTSGQTGNGAGSITPTPTQTATGKNWTTVFLGKDFSCGTTGSNTDATMYCWGINTSGQLAHNDLISPVTTPQPIAVPGALQGWQTQPGSASAANGYACAVDVDEGLWCWGNNSNGQFGSGQSDFGAVWTTPEAIVTTPGPQPVEAQSVAAGDGFSCLVSSSSFLLDCSGLNDVGQLATGTAWYSSPKP